MSRWWRAYDEAVDDPKLLLLSDRAHRAWFNLMCLASIGNGRLPERKVIELKLRLSPAKTQAVLNELMRAGLIEQDDKGLYPHNWNGRQYKSDVSTERVKRFRNTKRNVSETPPETETEDSVANATGAGAPVSPPPDETPEARLWRVGLTDLIALGVKEQQARRLIGSWRRDTGDDCQGVLAAIARAREYAVADPIPWITASLKRSKTNGKSQTVQAAAADLVTEIRKLNEQPPGVRGGEGQSSLRLLPQG